MTPKKQRKRKKESLVDKIKITVILVNQWLAAHNQDSLNYLL